MNSYSSNTHQTVNLKRKGKYIMRIACVKIAVLLNAKTSEIVKRNLHKMLNALSSSAYSARKRPKVSEIFYDSVRSNNAWKFQRTRTVLGWVFGQKRQTRKNNRVKTSTNQHTGTWTDFWIEKYVVFRPYSSFETRNWTLMVLRNNGCENRQILKLQCYVSRSKIVKIHKDFDHTLVKYLYYILTACENFEQVDWSGFGNVYTLSFFESYNSNDKRNFEKRFKYIHLPAPSLDRYLHCVKIGSILLPDKRFSEKKKTPVIVKSICFSLRSESERRKTTCARACILIHEKCLTEGTSVCWRRPKEGTRNKVDDKGKKDNIRFCVSKGLKGV